MNLDIGTACPRGALPWVVLSAAGTRNKGKILGNLTVDCVQILGFGLLATRVVFLVW